MASSTRIVSSGLVLLNAGNVLEAEVREDHELIKHPTAEQGDHHSDAKNLGHEREGHFLDLSRGLKHRNQDANEEANGENR